MSITWKLEVKQIEDENEVIFGDRQVKTETIKEAVRKAEDIIRRQYPYLFSPPPDIGWVVNAEENRIFRVYRRRDYRDRGNIDVFYLPKFSAIVAPLDVSLLDMPDYEERMLWEGIY